MASAEFKAEADRKLEALAAKQEAFGNLGPGDKAQLLDELLEAFSAARVDLPSLADAAVLEMGHACVSDDDATMPWCLEQVLVVTWFTGFCRRFKATLETVARTGACPPPKRVRKLEGDGRTVVDVFPLDGGDSMKPNKACTCELWLQPGKEATQGAMLSQKPRPGSAGLVLGAGNVGALGIVDCLHLLFQQNTVVLYKLHPLRTYQESFARKIFAPLISKGFFEVIKEHSGVADAQYLVSHPLLCHIHMTGSTETHDAIVWGPREGREERRKANKPVLDLTRVTMTSELGCVTPYMICPGQWTQAEISHHALHLAVCIAGNNGYYCNSPKVLVLAEGWPQREAFLNTLREILKNTPPLAPYYPGSHRRYQGFEEVYGQRMEKIQGPGFGESKRHGAHLPWTMVHVTVDPANLAASKQEYAFRNEAFCPMLCVCTLQGVSEPAAFLEAATSLSNDCLWGRLSCSLVVHPSTRAAAAAAVDKAIAKLEYGAVVINSWSAMACSYEAGCWGAYAGGSPPLERIERVESGLGFVYNALAFDHIEKCVVTVPFVDKNTQIGTGPPLTREATVDLTKFLITQSPLDLVKMLIPSLFRPKVKAALGVLGTAAVAVCASRFF